MFNRNREIEKGRDRWTWLDGKTEFLDKEITGRDFWVLETIGNFDKREWIFDSEFIKRWVKIGDESRIKAVKLAERGGEVRENNRNFEIRKWEIALKDFGNGKIKRKRNEFGRA